MTLRGILDNLTGLKAAYRRVPSEVLVDLARFCRATETCVIPGDRDRSLMLAGRHEVWLRLQEYRQLTPEQLYEMKTGKIPTSVGEQS